MQSNRKTTKRVALNRVFGSVALACVIALPSAVLAQNVALVKAATLVGGSINDAFGSSVASVGDVNGDGFNDLLVGSFYDDTVKVGNLGELSNTGSAFLYLGTSKGFPATLGTSAASAIFTGSDTQSNETRKFGYTVSGAGDINGDGLKDFAIASVSGVGEVDVFFGRSSGFSGQIASSTANVKIGGSTGVGRSVASGDFNGDGKTDLLIGEQGSNRIYVFNGASSLPSSVNLAAVNANVTTINGPVATSFGLSVASAGDVNKDGFDDILVGAPNANADAGSAYVILGRASFGASSVSAASVATKIFTGVSAGDHFGSTVSGVGDIDKDGFVDIAIGAQSLSAGSIKNRGASYVFAGAAGSTPFGATQTESAAAVLSVTILGDDTADNLGQSALSAGDVNADGVNDYLVAAHGADVNEVNSGVVALVLGSRNTIASSYPLASIAKATFSGQFEDDSAGNTIAGPFDSDNDGKLEYLVGAPGYATIGRAYIVEAVSASDASASSGTGSVLVEESTPAKPGNLSVAKKSRRGTSLWNFSFLESSTGAVRYEVDLRRRYSIASGVAGKTLTAQTDWKTYRVNPASGREILTGASTLRKLSLNLYHLRKNTKYLARVRACNATKCSAYTATKSFNVK